MELLKADSCIWQWQAERLTHKQTLILLLFWTWLSLSLSLSSEWQQLLLNECLKSENKNKHEVFPLVFSLDCEQGGVLVRSLSVRLTRDVTMFNVWQERSQIVKHVKCSSGDELTLTLQLCVSVWFFCGDYFWFHQNSVWADRIVQMFFPNPCFYRSLKRFFFLFCIFLPVKKSLNVFYCYSFNYLFPCVNPSDISFVSFQEKFLSLCVFFSQFHTLKKCLFLCHFARDFLFFPLWKKKVLHITAKSKKKMRKTLLAKLCSLFWLVVVFIVF